MTQPAPAPRTTCGDPEHPLGAYCANTTGLDRCHWPETEAAADKFVAHILRAAETYGTGIDPESARIIAKVFRRDFLPAIEAELATVKQALGRAANEGRNVLPDATDDQASVIEQWALAALAHTAPAASEGEGPTT